jgi:predicted lipoprotein with Yx(FWY)xxD motif
MTRTRAALLAATAALGVVFLSACGSGYGSPSAAPAKDQPAATSAAGNTDGKAVDKADALRLAAATLAQLGPVVTDGNGMTLYRFDNDKPSVSTCYGACAAAWPPMLAFSDDIQVNGVDKALIGTITRKDGTKQVTLNKWPLYHFAKDTAPGDAKGQGVQGSWYASTPQGKKAAPAAAADAGSGYDY